MKTHESRLRFGVLFLLAAAQSVAQDPVKVAGNHYKLIAENDNLRIIEVTLAAGAKTVMHSHPSVIAVILDPSVTKWTAPDGKSVQSPPDQKRGAIISMKPETHVSENIGKTGTRAILVEFKKPAPAAGKGSNPSLPAPYKQVDDTPHARVFECTVAAGGSTPQHTHARENVLVALTDLTA